MKSAETRIRDRRFKLVVGCCLVYAALLIGGYLGSGEFVSLQMMTVGAYLAANGFQKHSENVHVHSHRSTSET